MFQCETIASFGSPVVPDVEKWTAGVVFASSTVVIFRQSCSPWQRSSVNERVNWIGFVGSVPAQIDDGTLIYSGNVLMSRMKIRLSSIPVS